MTQKEFDDKMQELSVSQHAEKRIYEIANEHIDIEKRRLRAEIDNLTRRLRELKDDRAKNLRTIKDINVKYHALKHQLCTENPKTDNQE